MPVTPEKPAVAGGTRVEQHRPPTPPLIDSSEKLSKEPARVLPKCAGDICMPVMEQQLIREIAEAEVALSSLLTFEREFEELMLEHARVIAGMDKALAKYAEAGGADRHILPQLVDRLEDAEKHITSTIHQIKVVNGLPLPPVPSIKRKARKKKANSVAPPELPKVSVKAVRYLAIFVKGVPGTVSNNEIQTVFDTKALVGRFESGHCKVLVPESDLGRALSRNYVSGHKIRVKKWRVCEDHHSRRPQNREVSNKTIGTRMKSIEAAMKRLLKRISD